MCRLSCGNSWRCVCHPATTQVFNVNVYERPAAATPLVVRDSVLLRDAEAKALSQGLGYEYTYEICYRGTRDGFASSTFHSKCDNLGPTLILGRVGSKYGVTGRLFGGFAAKSWNPSSGYTSAPGSWLFRIVGGVLERTRSVENWARAMYNQNSYCPTFGAGHDLYIASDCQSATSNKNSYSWSGDNYWLTGTQSFFLDEIEVFYRTGRQDPCQEVICEPKDQCHVAGECQAGVCSHPAAPEGTRCDDGNSATILDR